MLPEGPWLKVTCSEGNAFKLHEIEQNMTLQEKEFIEGDDQEGRACSAVYAHRGEGNAVLETIHSIFTRKWKANA